MADYTTTALLASIRRRCSIPTTSTTGSANSDLLAFASEEVRLRMAAEVLKTREDYYLRHYDVAIDSSTTLYRITPRALGGALRNVVLVDGDGNHILQLHRISQEKIAEYPTDTQTAGYAIEGSYIRLIPSASVPATATHLRMSYQDRPNTLVAVGDGARAITAINTGTKTVTVSSSTGFGSTVTADFIKGTPGFETLGSDLAITSTTGTTVVMTATLPTGLAVGDYICLTDTSTIPQVPVEMHPILAARVALKWLKAIQDESGIARVREELAELEQSTGILLSPRTEGSPKKIFTTNGTLGVL